MGWLESFADSVVVNITFMKSVTYKDWMFEVDIEATRQVYKDVANGGAGTCGCTNCKNYLAQIDFAFPQDIKQLLFDLGIDYQKDYEVWHYSKLDSGLHMYGGCFHFIGSFSEPDCKVKTGDNAYRLALIEVQSNFSIGFTSALTISQSFFSDYGERSIVEVNFQLWAPWVIPDEESE